MIAMTIGVYAMSITPFRDDGRLDEDLLRAHVRFLAEAGVGIYVCSQGSGEGDLLTDDEKLQCVRIAVHEVRGRAPVIAAGVGLSGATERIRDIAQGAARVGVDAVQVLGPRPGPVPFTDAELEHYFRTIIESAQCDVHLSDNSVLTGYRVPFSVLARLVEAYPQVRALNVSDARFASLIAHTGRVIDHFGDRIDVRIGVVPAVVSAHALGARGLLCSEANVAPRLAATVWRALEHGDGATLEQCLPTLLRCNIALSNAGTPRSLKAALRLRGRDGGAPRAPYLPLDADRQEALEHDLAALDLDATDP
jgi:4-hydroxy-tetrahydrodipicolinate synthase